MPRVDLYVPFDEKDKAKALGARWDTDAKLWYVPAGIDAAPFTRWRKFLDINVTTDRFHVAEARMPCAKCSAESPVFTFLLSKGWDGIVDEGGASDGEWRRQWRDVFTWKVTVLGQDARAAITAHAPLYFQDSSRGHLARSFLNHCTACRAVLDEPGSNGKHVFQPASAAAGARIVLHYYEKPFEASCHFQEDIPGDAVDAMRRAG